MVGALTKHKLEYEAVGKTKGYDLRNERIDVGRAIAHAQGRAGQIMTEEFKRGSF